MHFSAQLIANDLSGVFPESYKDILALKGVGEYTAAAISSIAFGNPYPVVDGNVIRVISRLLDLHEPIDMRPGLQKVKSTCAHLIQDQDPSDFNQSIMELGALICKPKSPDCSSCPISKYCKALKNGTVLDLPVKSKKLKKKDRYFNFFIIESKGQYLLQKRMAKDIWQGLYQFALSEVDKKSFQKDLAMPPLNLSSQPKITYGSKVYKQTLTHQYIYAKFHQVTVSKIEKPEEYILVNKEVLGGYAFPKIIDLYLSDKSIPLF